MLPLLVSTTEEGDAGFGASADFEEKNCQRNFKWFFHPVPDPAFYFDADPLPDSYPDPTPGFTGV